MNNALSGTRSSELVGEFQAWLTANAGDNEESLERLHRNLSRAIQNELTPRQQEVLRLFLYEGLRNHEIATRLGVRSSTVTRTYVRALKRLQRVLQYAF